FRANFARLRVGQGGSRHSKGNHPRRTLSDPSGHVALRGSHDLAWPFLKPWRPIAQRFPGWNEQHALTSPLFMKLHSNHFKAIALVSATLILVFGALFLFPGCSREGSATSDS